MTISMTRETRNLELNSAKLHRLALPARIASMREYELYVPLHYNDGRPVELEKLSRLKQRLVSQFGGLTHFPQENEGLWRVGTFTFRDRVVILRVLANDPAAAEKFFREIKKDLQAEWEQRDVLIVAREVSTI